MPQDDDTTPTHREADLRLVRIEAKIDDIPSLIHTTIEEGNYTLPGGMSPGDLLADHAELHASNRRIITALDGPETEEIGLDGHPLRLAEGGLVHQGRSNGTRLERIETLLGNGIKTKMDTPVKAAIITAAGAIIAATAIATIPRLIELL